MAEHKSIHGQWSTRMMFILAASGSAVGLGNIWKFPYITGEYGGGAFVLVYLACIALVGIPIMIAEIMLGRRGRQSPINTMRDLAAEAGASRLWSLLGWLGVIAGFLILSYYSVIAGWALAYVARAAAGMLHQVNAEQVQLLFSALINDPERMLAWHTLFMVMSMTVVARGVHHGLEQAVRVLMPLLLLLLLLLVAYAYSTGFFMQGVRFLFTPDFAKLLYQCSVEAGVEVCHFSGTPLLVALGHAFFTLSLGMGAIMVYGSYMPRKTSIATSSVLIALMDTGVALLAALAIFPIVFANGLEPGAGPGLIFQTLPIAFGAMAGGQLFATLFFVLLVFAAWTSAISLIEPAVAWLVEQRQLSRIRASILTGVTAWLLGIGTILSFNLWSGERYQLFGKTIFELLDFLTANIMLPLGGLLIALFAGWVMSPAASSEELRLQPRHYQLWRFVLRYLSPIAVFAIFLNVIGVL